jgi:hypothetical protein
MGRIEGNHGEYAMKMKIYGRDAYGNLVEEFIDVQPSPKLTIKTFIRGLIMSAAPSFMWNIWFKLGWTKFRRITKIKIGE